MHLVNLLAGFPETCIGKVRTEHNEEGEGSQQGADRVGMADQPLLFSCWGGNVKTGDVHHTIQDEDRHRGRDDGFDHCAAMSSKDEANTKRSARKVVVLDHLCCPLQEGYANK